MNELDTKILEELVDKMVRARLGYEQSSMLNTANLNLDEKIRQTIDHEKSRTEMYIAEAKLLAFQHTIAKSEEKK